LKIYNFSRVIAFPFAIWFAGVLYYSIKNVDYDLSYWMIPPFVIIAAIYTLSPQIDYWWLKDHPVPLDPPVRDWLNKHSTFYKSLVGSAKEKYETRLSIFVRTKDYVAMGKNKENVPEDVKVAIAHNAIEMTLGRKDFMFGDMDRYFIYKHPFPSPKYQFLHTVETHNEDGVMILSLEHLFAASVNEKQFYHIGKHAFAEAFVKQNPKIDWTGIDHLTWSDIEKITGLPEPGILGTLGFSSIDLLPVIITAYFTNKDDFKSHYPQEASALDAIFFPTAL